VHQFGGFRRDGAVAGGQFGFNWQVNSHAGRAEADYQWSNLDGQVSSSFRLGNVVQPPWP